jgi:uncharacterized protein YuzB (UPF0349 family)
MDSTCTKLDNIELIDEQYSCEIDCACLTYNLILNYIGKMSDLKNMCLQKHKFETKSDLDPKVLLTFTIPYDIPVKILHNNNIISAIRTKDDTIKTGNVGMMDYVVFYEKITLKAGSKETIVKFIEDIIIDNDKKAKYRETIDIFTYECESSWHFTTTQKKRSMDTIYLDSETKTKLINNIQTFINDREIYEKYGIPYKKSYLLTGPPGTGKTSIIYALASHFDLNIGICKLSSEKVSLSKAYKSLPKKTMLLIEDIEHVFPTEYKDRYKYNMSELLNVLDGVLVKDQLITFMTSNKITDIPKVILRPGRVDEVITFKYATKQQILDIYKMFRQNGESSDDNSQKFYEKVQNFKQLTPAILQKFLFRQSSDRKFSELEDIITMSTEKESALYT